jgi:hypothetical protein
MATIGSLEVERESGVVIYDTTTGEIVHRHDVVTMKGGKHPDEQTLEKDAHAQFSLAQPGRKGETAVLHINPRMLKPKTLYKVDVKNRALVEHPLQVGRIPRAPKR